MTTQLQLRVAEAKQRDVGKRRARIDREAMEALGVGAGDVIELVGKQRTVAIVWPADPEDDARGKIRIDGQTRKNAGVTLNDYVVVRKVSARVARSVTLAPVEGHLTVDREFAGFVKNRLRGTPLVEGDELSVVILGNPLLLHAIKVRPKGVVKIEASTKINLLPEPIEGEYFGPRVTYDDIGGLREAIRRLREIVELPLRHPEVFQRLGIDPPRGILLYGPPGCGKTLLAKALASEAEAHFLTINGPEIMNKYYGESEAKLREIFKEAKENAPSVIFIDEIDAIAPKREEVFGDVEKRVVAQLLALMDGLSERGNVIVIGATNRPDSVDPALRRPGRFDREHAIGVPNVEGRLEILQIHTRGMPLAGDVDLAELARHLHGYTGADLKALCREAALKALRRYLPEIDVEGELVDPKVLGEMVVTYQDFVEAMKEIVPTAMREFYVETPKVRWEDIGGLDRCKQLLRDNVTWAITDPERYRRVGVRPPKGVLLYGPPGCGKTLLAQALATESGANFIVVKGPEVLSKWVGESEKAIREIFRKAKASAPCIIFFDEIDALAKPRGEVVEDAGVGERVLSQLLTEMDASHSVDQVFVVAATNRPDLIDPSLLRPGRLDLLVYVPPPGPGERLAILRLLTKHMPLADDVDLEELASATDGYSGADLESLCRAAGLKALQRDGDNPHVAMQDFAEALREVGPSITKEMEEWYQGLGERLRGPRKGVAKTLYG